ncbi:DUF3710 domain-containing protein [Nocardioides sp.]|uniref:DUF3710 domain-containing protein n=1 Tax=Nocardioides sp. TaxID=35761 RepID=UPI003783DFC4
MKFRRKSAEASAAPADPEVEQDDVEETPAVAGPTTGPWDVDDLPEDDPVARVDLGSLLVPPAEGTEVQLQVDEQTEAVQAVLIAGEEGAVELRAFAAPRGGDLWAEVRPRIAADFAQRGGTADEREGRFGTELVCQLTVRMPDGRTGTQPSRIIGVNGPRWMLRATLLGRPAVEVDQAGAWEDLVEQVVVRRGSHPMPAGAELALSLPRDGQLVERPDPSAG